VTEAEPDGQLAVSRAERRWLIALLAGCAALSVTYGVVIPLGYAPDEPRHYAYVRLLVEDHKLPRTYPGGRERGGAIAVHPPLYYALLGVLYYPAKALGGAWLAQRLYRLISTGLGVCALVCVWSLARRTFPGRRWVPLLITAVTGLTPHFLMDQSIINNDAAANLACPLFVWFALGRSARGWRLADAAWCGVLLGLSALIKGQALACLPPVFLLVLAWDDGPGFWKRRAFWARAGIVLGLLLAISGWWYARNLVLYGQITYLPTNYRGIPAGMSLLGAWVEGIIPALMLQAVVGLFESLWAQIGWFPPGLADAAYVALLVLLLVALAGWAHLLILRRRGHTPELLARPRELTAQFGVFALAYLLVFYIAIFQHVGWFQGGRYILVGLSGFSTFLATGWCAAVPPRFRLVGAILVLALLLVLNAVSIWNLLANLNPTYAPGAGFWTPIQGT
jgi:hypothetical protein